jgi:hypothetical protein
MFSHQPAEPAANNTTDSLELAALRTCEDSLFTHEDIVNCSIVLEKVSDLLQHFAINKDDHRLARNPYHRYNARINGGIGGIRINLRDNPIILQTAEVTISCATLTIYPSAQHPTAIFIDEGGRIACSMKISGIADMLAKLSQPDSQPLP